MGKHRPSPGLAVLFFLGAPGALSGGSTSARERSDVNLLLGLAGLVSCGLPDVVLASFSQKKAARFRTIGKAAALFVLGLAIAILDPIVTSATAAVTKEMKGPKAGRIFTASLRARR